MDSSVPSNSEAEQSVIGAILLKQESIDEIIEDLKPEHFFYTYNRDIYKAILTLLMNDKPVDIITITDFDKTIDLSYVASIAKSTPSHANIKSYSDIIIRDSKRRDLINIASELNQSAMYSCDVEQSKTNAYNGLELIDLKSGEDEIAGGAELAEIFINDLEANANSDGLTGWSTGDSHIDEVTGGLRPGDYIGIAARSGGGKTTKALNILTHFVKSGRRCLMFSMEMKKDRLMQKIISDIANVKFSDIKNGSVTQDDLAMHRISEALRVIKNSGLHVDDTSGLSISDIEKKAKRFSAKYGGVDLIVIDYVQRLKIDSGKMYAELTSASNRLKDLFMKIGCAGLVLAQLKKNSMAMPNASDLRETGAIENDSDTLIFIHTDTEDRKPRKGFLTCEIFNKVRFGETCIKMMRNELEFQRFVPIAGEYEEKEDKPFFT